MARSRIIYTLKEVAGMIGENLELIEEAPTRTIGAPPEFGNAQFDGPGPRLPVPVAIPLRWGHAQRVLLAISGTGGGTHLHLH